MTGLIKARTLLLTVSLAGFIVLGIRAYGYFTNDQSAFLLVADAFAHTGKLIAYPESATPYYGNFHPPLMLILLGCFIRVWGLMIGPMLFLVSLLFVCFWLLLVIQKRVAGRVPSVAEKAALCLLFFLVPFTHESVLFLDIDNTVLIVWGAFFLLAHYFIDRLRTKSVLYPALIMGVVLAIGLWCKLTTPLIVFVAWIFWRSVTGERQLRELLLGLLSVCFGVAFFFGSYLPFGLVQGLPLWYPISLGMERFHEHQTVKGPIVFCGSALRAIFFDMHWFSFLFLPLIVAQTVRELRRRPRGKKEMQSLFPLFMFWAIYLVYTFIMPTCLYYMPRYKYGLLPFFVWWMWRPFKQWLFAEHPRTIALLGCAAVFLLFMLPDFPTSVANLQLWNHSFSFCRWKAAYYPESFVSQLSTWAALSKQSFWLLPFRTICFIVHYITWLGVLVFFIHCCAVAGIYALTRNVIRSLWLVIVPLWLSLFAANMSREYQLFYDAGTRGFPDCVGYLKKNLKAGEKFLGSWDFIVYTGHQAYSLYDFYNWRNNSIDTVRLDSVVRQERLRLCAYLPNDTIYKENTELLTYLHHNFDSILVIKDYRIWRKSDCPSISRLVKNANGLQL